MASNAPSSIISTENYKIEHSPTSLEAVRRLARFLDEVRVERDLPLIASPPRPRTPVRRAPPIRPRSSQIAAQSLAHIPASKRSEVLLNKRLGSSPKQATRDRSAVRTSFARAEGGS